MKIRVTQEDIAQGKSGKGRTCPVALALKRAGFKDIYVGRKWIEVCGEGNVSLGGLDPAVKAFITAFDNDQPVQPFEFDFPNDA